MFYISEEQAKERLDSPDNLLNRLRVKELKTAGRPAGKPNFSTMEKVLAGSLAHIVGNKEAADIVGMSPQHVMNIKNGKEGGEEVQEQIKTTIGKARDVALEKLVSSLDALTPSKISSLKARDAAAVARDMSTVVDKLTPKEEGNKNNGVIVQIYAPQQHTDETVYPVVEVGAEKVS